MPGSPAALRFPYSRVLLPRTRLAYVHLRNLLNDAKRDRAARISGYVAVSLPEELVTLYLTSGELVNATVRTAAGPRVVPLATALATVPHAPEYGEICFHEADAEQLAAMFATQSTPPDAWPSGLVPHDPASLFPFLMSTAYDGIVEIVANDAVNYLIFRNGSVARAFLTSAHHGTIVDRVSKLFGREARMGGLQVARWGVPGVLPTQASPALIQAFRELGIALVQRLVGCGRDSARAVAEHARQKLAAEHPLLANFSFGGGSSDAAVALVDPVCDVSCLTTAMAAWIREVIWAAVDHEAVSPDRLLRDLTWERRHMFQSAGLFAQLPWKVM